MRRAILDNTSALLRVSAGAMAQPRTPPPMMAMLNIMFLYAIRCAGWPALGTDCIGADQHLPLDGPREVPTQVGIMRSILVCTSGVTPALQLFDDGCRLDAFAPRSEDGSNRHELVMTTRPFQLRQRRIGILEDSLLSQKHLQNALLVRTSPYDLTRRWVRGWVYWLPAAA